VNKSLGLEMTVQRNFSHYYEDAVVNNPDDYKSYKLEATCDKVERSPTDGSVEAYITLTSNIPTENTKWLIKRKVEDFKELNNIMQRELKIDLALYEQYIPEPSLANQETTVYLRKIQEGIYNYLKVVLSIKAYYCPSLFKFIEFYEQGPRQSNV